MKTVKCEVLEADVALSIAVIRAEMCIGKKDKKALAAYTTGYLEALTQLKIVDYKEVQKFLTETA